MRGWRRRLIADDGAALPFAASAEDLTTAHLSDACLRLGITPRAVQLRPIVSGTRLVGQAVPVRHFGSVDIFLEAIELAPSGAVLVVDNEGRCDEACIGDLVSLEAAMAGIAGIVIWGCHRDTSEIRPLGLPLFSLGANSTGPMRLDSRTPSALETAAIADFTVGRTDFVVADDDGVLFLPLDGLQQLLRIGRSIRNIELNQAARARNGQSLRSQLLLSEFLKRRETKPTLTFRQHLQEIGGAIEI